MDRRGAFVSVLRLFLYCATRERVFACIYDTSDIGADSQTVRWYEPSEGCVERLEQGTRIGARGRIGQGKENGAAGGRREGPAVHGHRGCGGRTTESSWRGLNPRSPDSESGVIASTPQELTRGTARPAVPPTHFLHRPIL